MVTWVLHYPCKIALKLKEFDSLVVHQNASLAQLEEHHASNVKVEDSSSSGCAKNKSTKFLISYQDLL
jgi:hypothetical protein